MNTLLKSILPVVALVAGTLVSTLHAQPLVNIETVTVGDPGNAPDDSRPWTFKTYGSVAYEYQIGKYEITISQYA